MTPRGELARHDAHNSPRPELRLLVADAEDHIVDLLAGSLRVAGFRIATAGTGDDAVRLARSFDPDLLVLAANLPGMSGFEVAKELRETGSTVPAVFLTGSDLAEERIVGLTVGGDQCLAKPFSVDDAVARIGSALHRRNGSPVATPARVVFADLELDPETREVWRAGDPVSLSPTEFALLRYFLANPRRVLSKAQILDHVWSYDFTGEVAIVESYVSYLRRKIDTVEPRLLHTVRGVGYVLRLPPS